MYFPIPELSIGPYVRPSARTYFTDSQAFVQHDRDDFNISAGFDITWVPIKYLSLSADLTHSDDFSNNSGYSYDVTTPGVSLTGTLKF